MVVLSPIVWAIYKGMLYDYIEGYARGLEHALLPIPGSSRVPCTCTRTPFPVAGSLERVFVGKLYFLGSEGALGSLFSVSRLATLPCIQPLLISEGRGYRASGLLVLGFSGLSRTEGVLVQSRVLSLVCTLPVLYQYLISDPICIIGPRISQNIIQDWSDLSCVVTSMCRGIGMNQRQGNRSIWIGLSLTRRLYRVLLDLNKPQCSSR